VQQAQRVGRAVTNVGIAAHGRDREQVDLGPRYREADGERVVQAGVAVDDQRDGPLDGPEGRGAGNGGRGEERRRGGGLAGR
jgi:hypothetical protein